MGRTGRKIKRLSLWTGLLLVGFACAGQTQDARSAKQVFGTQVSASNGPASSYGGYAKGCLGGAQALAETGPTWQAMRLSRNRNWGHPDLVAFLTRLSGFAATQPGWRGLYVGDMSQPRGGPMLTGHASHQIGLDADIWMLPAARLDLDRAARESISSIPMDRAKGAYANADFSPAHMAILRAAARDPAVARIFVFPGAKVALCQWAGTDRDWLTKIRPWHGHNTHFHVRLNCPAGATACQNQDPPPPGDGCADAQAWVNDILNPPPPKPRDPNAPKPKPKPETRVQDLPKQCAQVLSAN